MANCTNAPLAEIHFRRGLEQQILRNGNIGAPRSSPIDRVRKICAHVSHTGGHIADARALFGPARRVLPSSRCSRKQPEISSDSRVGGYQQ
jgi:transposase